MTKDQYLRMVEQTGEEIDWDRCPPDIEDFPMIVLDALNIFNSLGNRVYPDVGFIGKDYSNLEFLYQVYNRKTKYEREIIFDVLLHLEADTQKESRRQIKAAYDKVKR